MKHANLSIFVPHEGCPHQCSFCDQRSICGKQSAPAGREITELCRRWGEYLKHLPVPAEIAFFGGSFTAIRREVMVELLEAASPFVENGLFSGIRISTRPDYIDKEILSLLKHYHVTSIELGAQSMCDEVLSLNRRGHTVQQVRKASQMISQNGFELGLQMMSGLYGSNKEKDCFTARELAALCPATVRIYPTIVVRGTYLAQLYDEGKYQPQTMEEAVALGAQLLAFFSERDIRVIRMGLHAEESLEKSYLAGPYHPSYRELCEGYLMYSKGEELLLRKPQGAYTLLVSPKGISKIAGHGGRYIEKFRKIGYNIKLEQKPELSALDVEIKDV